MKCRKADRKECLLKISTKRGDYTLKPEMQKDGVVRIKGKTPVEISKNKKSLQLKDVLRTRFVRLGKPIVAKCSKKPASSFRSLQSYFKQWDKYCEMDNNSSANKSGCGGIHDAISDYAEDFYSQFTVVEPHIVSTPAGFKKHFRMLAEKFGGRVSERSLERVVKKEIGKSIRHAISKAEYRIKEQDEFDRDDWRYLVRLETLAKSWFGKSHKSYKDMSKLVNKVEGLLHTID